MAVSRPAASMPSGSRAGLIACVGNAVEWYDFAIYGALASVLGLIFFPTNDPSGALLAAFALYGTAFVLRPAGAVLLGILADRWGRRRVLLIAVGLMTLSTGAVGVLPTYAAVGLTASALVVVLRGAQGLACGGEIGVLGAYLVETAPSGARARYSSGTLVTAALGTAAGMLVAGLLTAAVGVEGLLAGWWRLPFLLAVALGGVGFLMRRTLPESLTSATSRSAIGPAPDSTTGHVRRRTLRGFTLLGSGALAFHVFFVFLPAYLATHGRHPGAVLLVTSVMLVVVAAASFVIGVASDRWGRKTVAMGCAVVLTSAPFLAPLAYRSLPGLVVAQVVVGVAVAGLLNPVTAAELFSQQDRARGLGLTAGLATALVGGTAPLAATALVTVSGSMVVVGGYVCVVGLLALVALRGWPETAFCPLGTYVGAQSSTIARSG